MSLYFSWARKSLLLLSTGCALAGLSSSALSMEYVVKLRGEQADFTNAFSAFNGNHQVKVVDQHAPGQLVLVDIDDSNNLVNQVASLAEDANVAYIVPNIKFHSFDAPNDPSFSQQWALNKINALNAWEYNKGTKATVVAVIDTGIDTQHTDLSANVWKNTAEIAGNGVDDDQNGFVDDTTGWDFHGNDNDPMDETSAGKNPGHGTHCAGIIGAVGNNGVGVSGIAQNVSLMPIRFLGADGSGDLMAAAKAIDYAVTNKAHIISASWGAAVARAGVTPILEAIERAKAAGILFVAAAANDGLNNDTREVYPANAGFSNVISVAASDPEDKKPSWSNYGKAKVDLASPGLNILSTIPGNQFQNLSGTSMATPLVAGTVALLLTQAQTQGKDMKPEEIKALLQASGNKVEIETACNCRIDAEAALKNLENDALMVVPNAATVEPTKTAQFTGFGGKAPYTFTSSNPEAATIAADGTLTAKAKGETVISIKDAAGETADSQTIYVDTAKTGGGGGQCPFQGPLCDVLCQIDPTLPWCQSK